MPRSESNVIPVQLLAPPELSKEPSSQVSEPKPPSTGKLLNRQNSSPLWTSKARIIPA